MTDGLVFFGARSRRETAETGRGCCTYGARRPRSSQAISQLFRL